MNDIAIIYVSADVININNGRSRNPINADSPDILKI